MHLNIRSCDVNVPFHNYCSGWIHHPPRVLYLVTRQERLRWTQGKCLFNKVGLFLKIVKGLSVLGLNS